MMINFSIFVIVSILSILLFPSQLEILITLFQNHQNIADNNSHNFYTIRFTLTKQNNQQIFKYHQMSDDKDLSLQGHNVKPLIIELPSDDKIQKQSSIRKIIKQNNQTVKYSGGFKKQLVTGGRPSSGGKKALYRPEENQRDAYEQLGISKVQPKYREVGQNASKENNNKQSSSMQQLQDKIELLKKDRLNRNNQMLFNPKDEYTLIDNKERFQNVVHAQSSLDAITLQNIQARLQAHRKNLKPVEDEYNAKKGKMRQLDRFGAMKFNIDVDKQYAELQVDKDKIYELARKRQNMEPEEIQFQQLWELKKKNDPKLAQYDAKYQEYLVSKDAKNLLGATLRNNLYSWDKYTQPGADKSKKSIPIKAGHEYAYSSEKMKQQNNRSISKQKQNKEAQQFGLDGLASVKDIKDVIATKDDKFIASYIFAQIDTGKIGHISKEQLYEYLLSQKHVINGYNIDTKWLFTDLDNFETKRKGLLSKPELSIFLVTLQKIDHPKLILTNIQNSATKISNNIVDDSKNKQIVSTFAKNKPLFEKLFNALDFNDDKLIKRGQYIENIYIDGDCIQLLDEQAIRIKVINKSITYRQILGFIVEDYEKQRNEKLKKSKQYITFSRFCEYFDIPQSLDLGRIDKKTQKSEKYKSNEYQIYDIADEYLLLLKDIFNAIPRIYQDYIVSADFVQSALRDPQILALSDELCRIESVETKLPLESLQTTLHRMMKQCDEYSTWEIIKAYFSRRGRPLDWNYELISQKRQIRNQRLKEERKLLSQSKLREAQKYFQLNDQLKNRSKQKLSKIPDKYTVPQPFNIKDMKQKPNLEYARQGEKQFEELKKQFKANPINKQILQPKPELIMGRRSKKSDRQSKSLYKYQNYENDRIQRTLKRAQQQYQLQEKLKAIKQLSQIKANQIGIDLSKKYKDIIDEQQKKNKQSSKYKPTVPKASDSLYPKNPSENQTRKLQKVKENMDKAEEISKRKKQQLDEQKKRVKQKNQKIQQKMNENKKRDEQQQNRIDKILTDGIDFKPKINKRDTTQKQMEQIAKGREERLRKQQEQEQMRLRVLEEKKKKVLEYQKKQNYIPIQGLTDQEILERIDQIDFCDLLLDGESRKQYEREFDNTNKTRKELKDREAGLAGRERAAMQAQQKRMMDEKRKYKQQVQKSNAAPKQDYSRVSGKGEKSSSFNQDLNFHKSRALRRYRAIMEGKKPESQFDKYSVFNNNLEDAPHRVVEEENEDDKWKQEDEQ